MEQLKFCPSHRFSSVSYSSPHPHNHRMQFSSTAGTPAGSLTSTNPPRYRQPGLPELHASSSTRKISPVDNLTALGIVSVRSLSTRYDRRMAPFPFYAGRNQTLTPSSDSDHSILRSRKL